MKMRGEEPKIKYSCPICEDISKQYVKFKLNTKDEKFNIFSLSKGIPNCHCCGVNIDWNYKKVQNNEE